ncbi:DUF6328 family protein [Nocardioides sp. Bht2]|uniref:DUF6328 family protein n=1 Tax=Nocardioides sp. Bht2 TaxID=3392297 RepID=UPI0039B6B587
MDEDRLRRNWDDLLQELRVSQAGVQILTGFLLTVPFSSRFGDLSNLQQAIYAVAVIGSVVTTALVVAPVAFHRVLFREHARPWLVAAGNRCALAGLFTLALTVCAVLVLVFDVVFGDLAAVVVGAGCLLLFAVLWLGIPLLMGRRHPANEKSGTA